MGREHTGVPLLGQPRVVGRDEQLGEPGDGAARPVDGEHRPPLRAPTCDGVVRLTQLLGREEEVLQLEIVDGGVVHHGDGLGVRLEQVARQRSVQRDDLVPLRLPLPVLDPAAEVGHGQVGGAEPVAVLPLADLEAQPRCEGRPRPAFGCTAHAQGASVGDRSREDGREQVTGQAGAPGRGHHVHLHPSQVAVVGPVLELERRRTQQLTTAGPGEGAGPATPARVDPLVDGQLRR